MVHSFRPRVVIDRPTFLQAVVGIHRVIEVLVAGPSGTTWLDRVRQALVRSSHMKWIVHPQTKSQPFHFQGPHNHNGA